MEKLVLTLITVLVLAGGVVWGVAMLLGIFQISPLLGLLVLAITVPCLIFFGQLAYRQMRQNRDDPYRNIKY
ncbi:MAG: hypothetical protein Q4G42_00380 [Neisseria sp.]|nr:hypothetical protein [Neisseria sp.]